MHQPSARPASPGLSRVTSGRAGRARGPGGDRLRALFWAAAGLTVFRLLDPLGIDTAINLHTTETAARILGYCYQRSWCWHSPPAGIGQGRIAVVLYDQAYMDRLHRQGDRNGWPRPLRDHAELLSRLVEARARVVFFDLEFPYDRFGRPEDLDRTCDCPQGPQEPGISCGRFPGSKDLAEFACAIRGAQVRGTKVVLLQRSIRDPDTDQAFSTLLAPLEQATPFVTGAAWKSAYPGLVYPRLDDRGRETPAVMLRRIMRETSGGSAPAATSGSGAAHPAPQASGRTASDPEALFLAWGVTPSGRMPEVCLTDPPGLRVILPGLVGLSRDSEWARPKCPYLDTYGADDVLGLSAGSDADWMGESLQNRAVLVGLSHNASLDWIDSPIHQKLPGVFLHATALDNLLTFEEQGRRPYRFDEWIEKPLAVAVIWVPFLWFLVGGRGRGEERRTGLRQLRSVPSRTGARARERPGIPTGRAKPAWNAGKPLDMARRLRGWAAARLPQTLLVVGVMLLPAVLLDFSYVQAAVSIVLVLLTDWIMGQTGRFHEDSDGDHQAPP
jgi:CHASE2 domain